MNNNKPLNITSCLVRFFLNKSELCEKTYECRDIPVIPKKGEIVRITDDWQACKVTRVDYAYPLDENDKRLMIDVYAEDCDEDDEENW